MGAGPGIANHLLSDGHPLCGADQLGYVWRPETFDVMRVKGNACRACEIALERDNQNKINQEISGMQVRRIQELEQNVALISIQLHEAMRGTK